MQPQLLSYQLEAQQEYPATLLDGFFLFIFSRDASWTWHLHSSPLGPLVVRAEIPEDPSVSPLHLSGNLVCALRLLLFSVVVVMPYGLYLNTVPWTLG